MIFHENEKCPVCDKLFNESDDIVICPHCGTPHHRDCYNQLGHCVNSKKHKEGFDYRTEAKSIQSQKSSVADDNSQMQQSEQKSNECIKATCSSCGAEIDKSAVFCVHCGARQSNPSYEKANPVFNPGFSADTGKYAQSESTIDGVNAGDVAVTVRSNAARFLPKFAKNKKVSWNWAGFIFGPYYLFFRKMYKEGIVAMAVNLIANLIVSGAYVEQSSAFNNYIYSHASNVNEIMALTLNPSEELLRLTEAVMPMCYIVGAISVIVRIVIAVFSDWFYRKKVLTVIRKVDENLADGGSFVQSSMFAPQTDVSQSDMRKMYLSKLGGTSIFNPVIAYCALQLILSIISKI